MDIPITQDFNDKKVIGSARIELDKATTDMITNGLLTFSVGFISKFPEESKEVFAYEDAELVEISLIPTANYINYLKQKGAYDDNNNSTNSIET